MKWAISSSVEDVSWTGKSREATRLVLGTATAKTGDVKERKRMR